AATRREIVGGPLVPDEVEKLAKALVGSDPDAGFLMIEDMRDAGTSLEDIYLVYLAAAAQRLGDWWQTSQVSFAQVTIGTSRIYGILRGLDDIRRTAQRRADRSAVFATVPGETHTLGISMAADLFRNRGWKIDLLLGLSHDELLEKVEHTSHLIIGLSASSEQVLAALARLVVAIRIHRPDMRIFISGSAVEHCGDIVEAMSPDGMASDFETAVKIMEELWHYGEHPARQ
ncbi:MAG: cobalamin-dependent protein, partial [Pseudomonadota bacterium]